MRRLQCVRRKRRGPWALRQTERKSLQSADLNSGSSSAASLHKPFHSPAVNRETHYDSVSYQKTYGLRWTGSPGKPISSFTLPKRCHKLCRKPVANSQVVSIRRSGWYRRNHPPAALLTPCWYSVFTPSCEHGQTLVNLHLATGIYKWLQLPSSQGISRGSSISWIPLHHLRSRGGF